MERGALREGFQLFLRGARAGAVACASRVGVHLSNGEGARRDSVAALRWLHWAHRHGSSDAYNIAVIYAEGDRWRLAVRWWSRDAASGDPSSRIALAMCLLEGHGVRRDPPKARKLLLQTVRMRPPIGISREEHEWAMALLGVMAAAGVGTGRDLRVARKWLERANGDGDHPEVAQVLRGLGSSTPSPGDVAPDWWHRLGRRLRPNAVGGDNGRKQRTVTAPSGPAAAPAGARRTPGTSRRALQGTASRSPRSSRSRGDP
jgi:TPR repeat protein